MMLRHYQQMFMEERHARRWFHAFLVTGILLFVMLLALALCVGVVLS
ncbi:MAG: hypothetical protein JNN08_24070 [Bryobacterales bacterium]|nr:hypothetical protein [Bryobacterales bacterium]